MLKSRAASYATSFDIRRLCPVLWRCAVWRQLQSGLRRPMCSLVLRHLRVEGLGWRDVEENGAGAGTGHFVDDDWADPWRTRLRPMLASGAGLLKRSASYPRPLAGGGAPGAGAPGLGKVFLRETGQRSPGLRPLPQDRVERVRRQRL